MAKHDKEVRMMGRDWLNLSSRQRSLWVERAVRYWRGRGFPYVELSHDEAEREILSLLRCVPQKMFTRDSLRVSTVGLRLANYYHPQMWHVPVHDYKAPFESFQDDACLRECIRNSFRSFPDSNSVNARCLRATLKSYRRTTRVSNFRPTVARALCDRYSDAGGKVLDFSAGYGGRLLGCVSLPRNYIGIDPCTAQVTGLRAMAKLLKHKLPGTATIIRAAPRMKCSIFIAIALTSSSPARLFLTTSATPKSQRKAISGIPRMSSGENTFLKRCCASVIVY